MFRRLITWNARGGVISDVIKRQKLINLIMDSINAGRGFPVICIQEAGVREDGTVSFFRDCNYKYTAFAPYGWEAHRCNIAILTPIGTHDRYEVYGRDARQENRPMVCINVNGQVLIANIHATATGHEAKIDIRMAIENLQSWNQPWILIGDMNCDINALWYAAGVNNALWNVLYGRRFCVPNMMTHGTNRLDYAIQWSEQMFPRLVWDNHQALDCAGSDHCPVVFDVTF